MIVDSLSKAILSPITSMESRVQPQVELALSVFLSISVFSKSSRCKSDHSEHNWSDGS